VKKRNLNWDSFKIEYHQERQIVAIDLMLNMEIKLAKTDWEIEMCWDVLLALRPHLDRSSFLSTIKEMLGEGYRLAYIQECDHVIAAIGFRYLQFLYNGKHIYIDDLSTLPGHRGKGYGSMLLNYVFDIAREKGYKTVTLDSGYQRFDAHRLYLNEGFTLSSHHFSKSI